MKKHRKNAATSMKDGFLSYCQVGSVLGMSVAIEASKKRIKIHHEYDGLSV